MRQEIRRGLQGMEEVDTYDMLDRLPPDKRNKRCRGSKSVGKTCVDNRHIVSITFDDRIGVALERASDYIKTLPDRISEVKAAAKAVEKEIRKQR